MEKQDKIKMFETELNCILDKNIRKFATEGIGIAPDYFFKIPASSTGKYHPSYALGEGGIVRHTKACIHIALELFRLDMFKFTSIEQDCILASLLLHDTLKNGDNISPFTKVEHPILAVDGIVYNKDLNNIVDGDLRFIIGTNIETHMGQWTKDRAGKTILKKPKNSKQKFVHLVDYIASRKCLEVNFNTPFQTRT